MKKLLILPSILLVAALIIGTVFRMNITNYNDMGYYQVGLIGEAVAQAACETVLPGICASAPYVFKVKCDGSPQFAFKRIYQPAIVEAVYRGEGIQPGQQIAVSTWNSLISLDKMCVNTGFVNFMDEGEEYLVFLQEPFYSYEYDMALYITPEALIAPVFSLKEHDNVIAISEDPEYLAVDYKEVAENEFFVDSQESLEIILDFKKKMLQEYCGM